MSEAKTDPTAKTADNTAATATDPLEGKPAVFAEAVDLFASQTDLTVTAVIDGFRAMYGDVNTDDKAKAAVAALADPNIGTPELFKQYFPGIPPLKFTVALNAFRAAFGPKAEASGSSGTAAGLTVRSVLPPVPGEDILTNAFRAGGISNVSESHVVALTRSMVANESGVYQIPKLINEKVTVRLEELKRPAPPVVCVLRRELRSRKRSEMLAALEESAGGPAEDDDLKKLLQNGRTILLPAMVAFYTSISTWREELLKSVATVPGYYNGGAAVNPLLAKLAAAAQTPKTDTKALRRAANTFIEAVNWTFTNLGVLAAVTLMERGKTDRELLDNRELRSLLEVGDEREMLQKLGLKKNDSDKEDEGNLAQFVIAIMGFQNTTPGTEVELEYVLAMIEVGGAINWPRWGQMVPAPFDAARGNGRANAGFGANRVT